MSEHKHMNSIARRISHSFVLRLMFALLLTNILLAVSALAWSAYSIEKTALGSSWQLNLERSIKVNEQQPFLKQLEELEYHFGLAGQQMHQVQLGEMMHNVTRVSASILWSEVLLVFLLYRGHRRRVRYLMQPLHQMSRTAEELSQVRFDEQAYHNLEDAIESLDVLSPSEKLSTGHSELVGLENAVNNLMGRMHDNYRQQIRFVSDASHELRTPIAVIRGYADLLDRWGKDDRKVMEESVAAIRDEADNMQRLVEQLLFLARGDSGRNPFLPQAVDLMELAREAKNKYALINQDHVFKIRGENPVWALGDEALLKQAVRVLADNAVKYSPPGTAITLRVFQDEKGLASISVQDNGAGIPAKDLPHIFERFYRADPARGRGGTGLGLSIARWIAERHGGHIDVFSHEGLGTRFTLHLPVAKAKQQGRALEQEENLEEEHG